MQCRRCGTEIADKAIVCYRCGAATTDPVRRPAPLRPRRSSVPPLIATVFLVLCALAAAYIAPTAAEPDRWRAVAAILAGAAAVVLILGLVRSGRSRTRLK